MTIRTSNSTSATRAKLRHIERSILSCKIRGFSTKKLYDARSQYIAILSCRGHWSKKQSILFKGDK